MTEPKASIAAAMQAAADSLSQQGHETRTYVVPAFEGYAAVTGQAADLYGLEMRLGPAAQRQGASAWGVAHLPDPRWPNLCFMTMIERDDKSLMPEVSRNPVYNPTVDRALDYVFLPALFTSWNTLDPLGRAQSVVVQAYQAAMTLSNLVNATQASLYIMQRFKHDGQLALIAVDFADPLITGIAGVLGGLTSRQNIHFFPRTKTPSNLRIPLPYPGGVTLYDGHSTAVDEGFATAVRYLEQRKG